MKILIGQDTELFLKKGDDIVSAYGIIPGSKQNPYPVKKGAVQVDGMALEINTHPASTLHQFKTNINTVLSRLHDMIPKDHDMIVTSVAHFSKEYMDAQPEEAKLFGCDPDYNAYTGQENQPPDSKTNMRTAAGHIHIGWTKDKDVYDSEHITECCILAKQLDYTLGVPSIVYDNGQERRQLYGKAGTFRPKPYGIEYRVLSNYWITRDEYMQDVFSGAKKAFLDLERGKNWSEWFQKSDAYKHFNAQNIINNNEKDNAQRVMSSMNVRIRNRR